jgi:hypothetical protein
VAPLHRACQAGLAVSVFLLVLAVLRWGPVYAHPLADVRALAAGAATVLLAVGAALTAPPEPARGWWRRLPLRPLLLGIGATAALLAALVATRGPQGLPAEVSDARGPAGSLPPGPVDLIGSDLRGLSLGRRITVRWQGALHVPEPGAYRLWVTGRGRAEVAVDGRPVLDAEGDSLRGGADLTLGAGAHELDVRLHRTGPGPRLRLGWTRPGADGRASGEEEAVPPRMLGPPAGRLGWALTDVLAHLLAVAAAALVVRVPWAVRRPLPPAGRVTPSEVAWSVAGHAVLVGLMSWPLLTAPARLGVTDRPDGRLNAWILAWDVHALTHEPSRLFQAPAFHPLPDALAFSENLLVPAVLSAPGQWLGGPVLGYNLALVVSLIVSGLGVQLLVRRASGAGWAAFVAGAFFAVGAHRWIRLAHLHAQVTLFLPFVLLALDRYLDRRTWPRALAVGGLVALQALSSVYVGAIAAAALSCALAVAVLARALTLRDGLRLGAGFVLAAALLAPVARPYLRMRSFQGVEWTLDDVARYATTLESYAASGTRLYGGLTQRHLDPERVQDTLFPGVVLLSLGLAGLAVAPRRYQAVGLLASAVAVVLSLGPETALYRVLHEHVILVRSVRALSRFSLLPVLVLCVASGFALARRRWVVSAAALALFCLESSNVPIRYGEAAPPSPAAAWLAGREGAVVDLPLGERDTEAMLQGLAHLRPLVNGDSGFMPRPYSRLMELLRLPLEEEALRYLRAVDVRHVVAREDQPLPLATRSGDERIYEVPPGEAARVVVPGPPASTRWTPEGTVLDLGAEVVVSAVGFEVGDGPWISQPLVRVSADGRDWRRIDARASLGDAVLSLMRDPRHGTAEVGLSPTRARYLSLPPDLPVRPGLLYVR